MINNRNKSVVRSLAGLCLCVCCVVSPSSSSSSLPLQLSLSLLSCHVVSCCAWFGQTLCCLVLPFYKPHPVVCCHFFRDMQWTADGQKICIIYEGRVVSCRFVSRVSRLMSCRVVACSVVPCSVVPYRVGVLLCSVVFCSVVLCCVLFCSVLFCCLVFSCAVLFCVVF
jgi:hypothetical protein